MTEARSDEARQVASPENGRLRRFLHRNRAPIQVTLLFILFLFTYFLPDMLFSIYPGQAGVLWKRFGGGTETDWVFSEGFHFKFPWDELYVYDIRLQQHRETYDVLSKDGLAIDVEVSVRYRLDEEGLGLLHKNLGPDYVETLLGPEIGSLMREHISQYRPEELYTKERARIEKDITKDIIEELKVRYRRGEGEYHALHVEGVLIRSITLPEQVADMIEKKLVQEQRLLEFEFRLKIEEKERDRKEIEASGIRLFQDIVSEGISEQYLKWKGIDATLELARSNNSKIVVIGAGQDGLPIILGGLDFPRSAEAAAPGPAVASKDEKAGSAAVPPSAPEGPPP